VIATRSGPERPLVSRGDAGVTASAAVRDSHRPHPSGRRLGYVWDVSRTTGRLVPGQPMCLGYDPCPP